MATVEAIRRQIVEAKVSGQDTARLEQELQAARLEEATQKEVGELKKIADQRLEWQKEAEKIKARAAKQGESIDRLLALRDAITGPLKELIEQAKAKGLIAAQNECYTEFHDGYLFGCDVNRVPKGYLPEGFTCPCLVMVGGQTPSYDKAVEALWYMEVALGCLTNLTKGEMAVHQREVDDGIGHTAEVEEEDENQPRSCIVCSHAEVETINGLLRQDKPLRDIETKFDVSRSSLSRHKNNCLNLGAVRMHD